MTSPFVINSNVSLPLEAVRERYGLTEEQAKRALQDPHFVEYVQSSAVSTIATSRLIGELTAATVLLTELAEKR